MAVEIGALRALLSLDSAAFEKGAKRARAAMGNVERRMRDVARGVARAGKRMAIGFGVAVAAIGTSAIVASRNLTDLSNQARLAGLSAGEFKTLAIASSSLGIEQEKLADILKDVDDKFGDFMATGKGPLQDFFDEIAPKVGLTKEAFEGLSSSDALQLYVSALEGANVSQQEMTFFMEALASDATALVPIFQDNGKALKDVSDRAKELGLNLSGDTIKAATAARQEFGIVAEVMKTRLAAALTEILPAITELAEVAIPAIISVFDEVATVISSLAALLRGDFKGAWELIQPLVIRVVEAIKNALVGLATAAPGLIADFGRALLAGLSNIGQQIWEKAGEIGRNIIDGIKQGIRDQWESLKQQILSLGSGLPEWIKGPLGIQSPSRVFMDIGRDIMAGLGIGVSEGRMLATGPLVDATGQMRTQMDTLGDSFETTGGRFGDMVADIVTGARSAGDVLKNLGDQLIRGGINGLFGGGTGGGGNGILGMGNFLGFLDKGGIVPSGSFAIAGERGPEIVTGPARVTSRADTARMMGASQPARVEVVARVENGNIVQTIREVSGPVAAQVMQEGLSAYDRSTLPKSVDRISNDPRRRG